MSNKKTFVTYDGKRVEVEREVKTLKLISVRNSDYYDGKNHDQFEFRDNDNNKYVYDATLNADMTEYDTKFAKDLAWSEGKMVRLSGYFLPPTYIPVSYIYLPRLLDVEQDDY